MTRMTYVNRKSEGVKLGQIVAKDLRKRLKLASKPESQRVAPHVQLELEGKQLTDEGLRELVEGLHDATKPVDGITTTRLQLWNLSGNKLTSECLPYLTKALKAISLDIEELDLSQNAINVSEPDDLINWEEFLKWLGACQHLHRVVLTDNAIGSGPAMEVFARVAIYSKLPDKKKHGDDVSAHLNALQIRDSNKRLATLPGPGKPVHPVVTSQCLLSIPSWSLDNISLTDEGALFLSYVAVRHDWIHNGPLSTGGSGGLAKDKQDSFKCFPNDATTSVGSKLLRLAQGVKEHELVTTTSIGMALLPILLNRYERTDLVSTGVKTKSHSNPIATQIPISQPLVRNTGHTQVYSSAVEELESLRKKIQRGIIENHGASRVELWRAALKLLGNVRGVMIEPLIFPPSTSTGWKNNTLPQLPTSRYSEKVVNSVWPKLPCKASHAAFNRDEFARDVRKNSHAGSSNSVFKASKSDTGATPPECSYGVGPTESATCDRSYPPSTSSQTLKILPANVWETILLKVSDPQNLLSERQRRAIIEWGRSRSTLAAEMGSIGKLDSVQIWRVLDAMHCLSYDLRE